jgi:calcineurin-like phosphoesterase family protein
MKSKFWIFSDPHLGHNELFEEGFRPENFSERIMAALHLCLNPGDVLICLGDFSYREDEYWHERLSHIDCKKWLCLGNHDKRTAAWYLDHHWDWVGHYFREDMFGKRILFSHKPKEDTGHFDLNIHGHFHTFGLKKVEEVEPELFKILTPKHKLISMESLNYEPIKLQRFVEDF